MVLDRTQSEELTDFTGAEVVLGGRTKEVWQRIKAGDGSPWVHFCAYRDLAGFAALVFMTSSCKLHGRPVRYFDYLPFVREFLVVLRERVHFGFIGTIDRWFERAAVCVDIHGFFQCDLRVLDPPRIRIRLWEDGRLWLANGRVRVDQAAEGFVIQHMHADEDGDSDNDSTGWMALRLPPDDSPVAGVFS